MRVLQIRTSGYSEVVDVPDGLDALSAIYDMVGEFIDTLSVKDGTVYMWFNQTGGAFNPVATSLVGAVENKEKDVWGDVIFTGGIGEDDNFESLEAAPALKIWADRIKEKIVG